ncbi:hypothetical protein PQR64_23345 [Paraburkholderia phytofirmans]|uniref:hypothetical protein n=1 Tax=Paraburkholderia phytofirmans TaxID=261302 RepID=UPI0038BB01FB
MEQFWESTKIAFGIVATALTALGATAFAWKTWGWKSGDVASWIQAVGSIAAIIGAIWISNSQYRREQARHRDEAEMASYRLMAELNWLSGEIVGFLNQFAFFEPGQHDRFTIGDDEVADILDRLTWCRQHAEHKGQLAMLGVLRRAFIETLRLVRVKAKFNSTVFGDDDIKILRGLRKEALEVFNHAVGVTPNPQFSPTHQPPQN